MRCKFTSVAIGRSLSAQAAVEMLVPRSGAFGMGGWERGRRIGVVMAFMFNSQMIPHSYPQGLCENDSAQLWRGVRHTRTPFLKLLTNFLL